ncbi:MAG: PepSY domain-containing protein [Lachnospiraceae bacterium]|nr:PepSY domain-containing protein [Lachnospiraceae bacterium]
MKTKIFFYTFALTALLLGGCSRQAVPEAEKTPAADSSTPSADTATQQQSGAVQNQTAVENQTQTVQNQADTAQGHTDAAQNNSAVSGNQTDAQNNGTETNMISEEKAREIALSHAGLTADQVTFIKSGLDRDDGRKNYDVEFYSSDQKEYDYEIDPYTGEILEYDYDAEYYSHSDGSAEGNNNADKEKISEEKARQIALERVPGAAAEHIREFKSDYDNSRLEYEGKIYYNQKEYEFEIDGHTGEILEWDEEPIYGNVS